MNTNTKLKKYIRESIAFEIKQNPDANWLSEGFVSRIANHLKKVLSTSATQRYDAELSRIAKTGPAGKKAVKKLVDTISQVEKDMKEVDRLIAKYGID
jgi:hypothetical protein